MSELKRTVLYDRHVAAGATLVDFGGWEMPIQYPTGIVEEHLYTRSHCGLFDVSHMGQGAITGPDFETVARAFEALVPGDILGLAPGQQRYTLLLNEQGGIIDDLMVSRPLDPAQGRLNLVVNAACKTGDFAHIEQNLPEGVVLETAPEQALLALQGPAAVEVLEPMAPPAAVAATVGRHKALA